MHRLTIAIVTATCAIVAAMPSAAAAVRKCGSLVSSDVAFAPTELEAKKKAMDQWRSTALKLGPGFDSWRLANQKSLKCFPKNQGFECVAFGAPCVIDQTPNTPIPSESAKGQGV